MTLNTHQTQPVSLVVLGNHRESIQFYVYPTKESPLVLGYPCLSKHNPLQSALPEKQQPPEKLTEYYHDLRQVFRKDLALSLPPHRPYDCAIDLLPGAPLPSGHLVNLSTKEREAMEKYMQDSLDACIIRTSSSPLGAAFFFVAKKDGSLRPCIDYRGLNQITIKNKYSLPLLFSALEPVAKATNFSKPCL